MTSGFPHLCYRSVSMIILPQRVCRAAKTRWGFIMQLTYLFAQRSQARGPSNPGLQLPVCIQWGSKDALQGIILDTRSMSLWTYPLTTLHSPLTETQNFYKPQKSQLPPEIDHLINIYKGVQHSSTIGHTQIYSSIFPFLPAWSRKSVNNCVCVGGSSIW